MRPHAARETRNRIRRVAVLTPILVGTDGNLRMSKSTGNYIGIDEPPNTQYGKAMSIPDDAIVRFFDYGTNLADDEVDQIETELELRHAQTNGSQAPSGPLDRRRMARLRGSGSGLPRNSGRKTFSQRNVPDDIPEAPIEFAGADTQSKSPSPSSSTTSEPPPAEPKPSASSPREPSESTTKSIKGAKRRDSKWGSASRRPP